VGQDCILRAGFQPAPAGLSTSDPAGYQPTQFSNLPHSSCRMPGSGSVCGIGRKRLRMQPESNIVRFNRLLAGSPPTDSRVGDLMLDEFIWGRVSRISPKRRPRGRSHRRILLSGGAANVARNVRSSPIASPSWCHGADGMGASCWTCWKVAASIRRVQRDAAFSTT